MSEKVRTPAKPATERMAEVVESLIEDLKLGEAGEWQAPWQKLGLTGRPRCVDTGETYKGGNFLSLMLAGYDNALWGTFRQWKKHGCYPREKAGAYIFRPVFREKEIEVPDGVEGKGIYESKGGRRVRKIEYLAWWSCYAVFNAEQVEGDWSSLVETPEVTQEPIAHAETFVKAMGARIVNGGDSAFWRPSTDTIHMPTLDQFDIPEMYYSILGHELTHWTGAKDRLNRDLKRYGANASAVEELVAELGAAFFCADLMIETQETRQDHLDYINEWIEVLRESPTALWSIASQAEKAVNYMHELQPKEMCKTAAA